MKINPDCVLCQLNVRLKEIINFTHDKEKVLENSFEIVRYIVSQMEKGYSVQRIATYAFRKIKELTNNPDPYREEKRSMNNLARELVKILTKKIKGEVDDYRRFRLYCIASINSNSLDTGVFSHSFTFNVSQLLNMRLSVDHVGKLYSLIMKKKRIVFILDNAGEAVFDMALIREMLRINPKLDITCIVKSRAFQNDLTYSEAEEMGLGRFCRLMATGSDAASLIPGEVNQALFKVINESDILMAKGMANYETLMDLKLNVPTFFLLKAKCKPVAETLNIEVGGNVVLRRN